MNERVIILGTAPTLTITPWDLPDTDYWACAPVITHKPAQGHRIDVLFEMHGSDYWMTIIDRLNEFVNRFPNVAIYMQKKNEQIKNVIEYPLKEVQSFLNHPRLRNYFTSTIAYMVALALMVGYKKIELYGVHMASEEEEYSLQKECLAALLAFGWGRGVDFWLPDESDILKSSYLYGYEQGKGFLLKAIQQKEGLANGEKELANKFESLKEEYWMQKGGVLAIDKFIKDLRKQGIN